MLDIQRRGQPRHTQIIKSTLCYGPKRLEIDEDGEDDEMKIQKNEHGNTQTRANHMVLSCPLVNVCCCLCQTDLRCRARLQAKVQRHQYMVTNTQDKPGPSNTSHHESLQRIIAAANHSMINRSVELHTLPDKVELSKDVRHPETGLNMRQKRVCLSRNLTC